MNKVGGYSFHKIPSSQDVNCESKKVRFTYENVSPAPVGGDTMENITPSELLDNLFDSTMN